MSQLRYDPLYRRWVIIAPERQRRPGRESAAPPDCGDTASDPFAEGQEHFTTPEIYAVRDADTEANGPGWQLRVVPNMYPALRVEYVPEETSAGPYKANTAVGAHEVVIETPRCGVELSELNATELTEVLQTWQLRCSDLMRDQRLVHVCVFKNHGQEAGATQGHSHSQIIATPFVPQRMLGQLEACREHWQREGRGLLSDVLGWELNEGSRIVTQAETMVLYCPFAAGWAFGMRMQPRTPRARFTDSPAEELADCAQLLRQALRRWRAVLGPVAYNIVLHNAPSLHAAELSGHTELEQYYCWHFELWPRLQRLAGFEIGTGSQINTVPPEDAAQALREAATED